MGNTPFVSELIREYPDLMWRRNDSNHTIFHTAVSHRHVDIHNLVHELGLMKDMITPLKDEEGNNMLHVVGKCSKQMPLQQEWLWFKEVKDLMPFRYREQKNNDGQTPHQLFMEEHKILISENGKWMKDTANQSLIVAALLASVGLTAVITVPGGYNPENGMPMFLHNKSFIIFALADAFSLTYSTISIFAFLSIFIFSLSTHELLEPMPKIMILGVGALFSSISTMLIGFIAAFYVLYQGKFIWIPFLISILISGPLTMYGIRQKDFLRDYFHSAYASEKLFGPQKRRLNYKNPTF